MVKRGAQIGYADGTLLTHIRGREISFYFTEGEVHVSRRSFELIMDGKIGRRFWKRAAAPGASSPTGHP